MKRLLLLAAPLLVGCNTQASFLECEAALRKESELVQRSDLWLKQDWHHAKRHACPPMTKAAMEAEIAWLEEHGSLPTNLRNFSRQLELKSHLEKVLELEDKRCMVAWAEANPFTHEWRRSQPDNQARKDALEVARRRKRMGCL